MGSAPVDDFPMLTALTFLPLVGALVIFFWPRASAQTTRNIALWTSIATFVLSIVMLAGFDSGDGGMQLTEHMTWLPDVGVNYDMGVDGISVFQCLRADPAMVAADLLSQAEHDPQAQVLLVSPSSALIDAAAAATRRQSQGMATAFAPVRTILCADLAEAAAIANIYAAEHLSLATDRAAELLPAITSAGAIFAGHRAAESFGDYLAGSSHVLPTDGAARFTGGVSTMTFMKAMTVQRITPRAARALAAPAAALARLEGLEAHARAAEARQ